MEVVIDFLTKSWVATLLALVSLVATIALPIYMGRKSARTPALSYMSYGQKVVSNDFDEDLEIRFRGEKIPRLCTCRLIIWNAGNTSIGSSLFPVCNGPHIALENNAKAVEVRVFRDDSANNVRLDESDEGLKLTFDFLDPGDGFVVQVLHTGEDPDLRLLGRLKGISIRHQTDRQIERWVMRDYLLYGMAITFILGVGTYITAEGVLSKSVVQIALGCAIVVITGLFFNKGAMRIAEISMNRNVPKKLTNRLD